MKILTFLGIIAGCMFLCGCIIAFMNWISSMIEQREMEKKFNKKKNELLNKSLEKAATQLDEKLKEVTDGIKVEPKDYVSKMSDEELQREWKNYWGKDIPFELDKDTMDELRNTSKNIFEVCGKQEDKK